MVGTWVRELRRERVEAPSILAITSIITGSMVILYLLLLLSVVEGLVGVVKGE